MSNAEFEKIRASINKKVILTTVSAAEEQSIEGKLCYFEPFGFVGIDYKLFSTQSRCSAKAIAYFHFIGACSGIKLIEDCKGNVIYKNDFLLYQKKFYDMAKKEDWFYVAMMKRKKFGKEHFIKLK